MPPSIQHALPRTTSTATITSLARAFSSTSIRQASQSIPPESPRFINVPTPPLSQAVEDRKIDPFARKGHLPIPRRIFKRKTYELPKTSPVFLSKSAPLPTSAKSQQAPTSAHEQRRRKMADTRRRNLNEGVTELWARKQQTDKIAKDVSTRHATEHRNKMNAPQRRDERFTETTIPASVLQTEVPRDPERMERALESRARTAAIAKAKAQDRQDALQHLYMAARTFIVDEKALEKQVEKLFTATHFSANTSASGGKPTSVWDVPGVPPTVREMMGEVLGSNNKVISVQDDSENRTTKRQTRVAEELTGGSLEEL